MMDGVVDNVDHYFLRGIENCSKNRKFEADTSFLNGTGTSYEIIFSRKGGWVL
jgi:hypothetical protein